MHLSEWKECKLGDVVDINKSTYKTQDNWEFINYLDTGNLTENRIEEVQYLETGIDKIPSRAKRKVKPGDVLYSTVRPNQKHYGIIKTPLDNMLVSTGFAVLSGIENICDSSFIYRYLTQEHITEYLHGVAENSTSAYPSLKPSDLEVLDINLPPLSEQQAIAEILGSLDDKIELNRKMNKTFEDMAQAIFKSWFVDFDPVKAKAEGKTFEGLSQEILDLFPDSFEESELGDIPKGWQVESTSNLFEVKDGTHASPKRKEEGFYLITSRHITGKTIDFANAYKISVEDYNEVNKRSKVDSLDILLTMIGTVGVPFLIQDKEIDYAIKNVGLFKTSQRKELAYYLYILLSTIEMQNYIHARLAGTTQKYITLKELRNIPLLIPEKLLQPFNEIVEPIFEKIHENNKEIQTLANLRDTLLPKLISGELRITEAEKLVEAVS